MEKGELTKRRARIALEYLRRHQHTTRLVTTKALLLLGADIGPVGFHKILVLNGHATSDYAGLHFNLDSSYGGESISHDETKAFNWTIAGMDWMAELLFKECIEPDIHPELQKLFDESNPA